MTKQQFAQYIEKVFSELHYLKVDNADIYYQDFDEVFLRFHLEESKLQEGFYIHFSFIFKYQSDWKVTLEEALNCEYRGVFYGRIRRAHDKTISLFDLQQIENDLVCENEIKESITSIHHTFLQDGIKGIYEDFSIMYSDWGVDWLMKQGLRKNTRKPLSATEKKQILANWLNRFPGMSKCGTMCMMNIIGPIVVGINLEVKSMPPRYEPSIHVHNLADKHDFVSLSGQIDANFDHVSRRSKPDKYLKLADMLEKRAIIPLEGDMTYDELQTKILEYSFHVDAYESFYFLEMYMTVAIWSGNQNRIDSSLKIINERIKNGYHEWWLKENKHIIDEFYEAIHALLKRTDTLRDEVEDKIKCLKLSKVSRRRLIEESL